MQLAELERPIIDVVPHIFKRPVLHVSPADSLLQVGTFLAIGPQIYVDGLVVLDGQKPVGRMGGQHIIQYILQHRDDWFQAAASQIMNHTPSAVEASDPLDTALEIFRKTKFAFVPITIDGRLATSLSIRDVLRLAADRLVTPIGELSSQLVSVKYGTSIEKALELMLEKGIRNLAVRTENNNTRIINDRKILEFLLSFEGRRVIASPMGLDAVSLELLDPAAPKYVKRSMSAAIAAQFLTDVSTPCLLCDDSIVTPWDVVMKGLLKA
ncbi:MAG TPA: CBS domain-containing protein [Nitrososphaera sp.]|nr:CBS domain-containing protein [Nitrososphaera sp.]